nr:MAG TPA: hypothetical protein [Caudoviricetes sp.]
MFFFTIANYFFVKQNRLSFLKNNSYFRGKSIDIC